MLESLLDPERRKECERNDQATQKQLDARGMEIAVLAQQVDELRAAVILLCRSMGHIVQAFSGSKEAAASWESMAESLGGKRDAH